MQSEKGLKLSWGMERAPVDELSQNAMATKDTQLSQNQSSVYYLEKQAWVKHCMYR